MVLLPLNPVDRRQRSLTRRRPLLPGVIAVHTRAQQVVDFEIVIRRLRLGIPDQPVEHDGDNERRDQREQPPTDVRHIAFHCRDLFLRRLQPLLDRRRSFLEFRINRHHVPPQDPYHVALSGLYRPTPTLRRHTNPAAPAGRAIGLCVRHPPYSQPNGLNKGEGDHPVALTAFANGFSRWLTLIVISFSVTTATYQIQQRRRRAGAPDD